MKTVTVLLSTYQGEQYLKEQLDSLYAQTGVDCKILVRDDGSRDQTCRILEAEQEAGRLRFYTGENKKPGRSFLDLVQNAPESDYYAFCDQDDIWLPDKLSVAVNALEGFDKPSLYYGRPRLVSGDGTPMESPKNAYDRFLKFPEAFVNSNATGCTMVFNRALLLLVREKEPDYLFMHDVWVHKLCIAAGGNLVFDEDVHILYRQHGGNVIGGAPSVWKKLKQHYRSLTHGDCIRSKTVAALLMGYGELFTGENRVLAEKIAHYRDGFGKRLSLLFDRRIRTGYPKRDRLYRLAVLLGVF